MPQVITIHKLLTTFQKHIYSGSEEPRIFFFQGGYLEDHKTNDQAKNGEEDGHMRANGISISCRESIAVERQ